MSKFKSFCMTFLMIASILLQGFSPIYALQYSPAPLDYSSPKKTSEAFKSRADDVSMAVIGHAINFANNPHRGWEGSIGHRMEQTAKHFDKKALQTGKLAKKLETNTVAGKAPSPRARTRSQTRKMTSPYSHP